MFTPQFQVRRWTPTAAECYLNGCNCSTCPLPYILETKCLMKAVVIELVRKFGPPDLEKIKLEYKTGYTKY